jgi:hypothetical protein
MILPSIKIKEEETRRPVFLTLLVVPVGPIFISVQTTMLLDVAN